MRSLSIERQSSGFSDCRLEFWIGDLIEPVFERFGELAHLNFAFAQLRRSAWGWSRLTEISDPKPDLLDRNPGLRKPAHDVFSEERKFLGPSGRCHVDG